MLRQSQCFKRGCRHFIGAAQPDGTERTERVVCRAYPDGIPREIAYGEDSHSTVRSDQRGEFVFEKSDV